MKVHTYRGASLRLLPFNWRDWLRASGHTAIILGFALIALFWSAVEFDLWRERTRAETAAQRTTENLARVFENQILGAVRTGDRMTRALQQAATQQTLFVEFQHWAGHVNEFGSMVVQLSMTDAAGNLIASSTGALAAPVNIADREHFTAHQNRAGDELFISKPVLGRASGKWSVQLSRAYRDHLGNFGGVLVVSLSAEKLSAFYESIDLGPDGSVLLLGLDGVVRASAGFKIDAIGTLNPESHLLQRARVEPQGQFTTHGALDGVARITSYRTLDGYPLVISVGQAEHHVFGDYWRNRYVYRAVATALTLLILIGIAIGLRHQRRLEQAQRELHASEARAREKSRELELTLDHMNQGIIVCDADMNVAMMNRQVVKLLGLPEELLGRRVTFGDVLAYQRTSGEFDDNHAVVEPQVRRLIEQGGGSTELALYERVRPDGTVLEVRTVRLPNGGFLRTFTDITERKRSADKIAHMAHHDPLTGLANRVLLRDRIENALARQRRHGESFALMLIDLDRFKEVNDTLGHATGDQLLRHVAQRLRSCVREIDTVARLGGDEFAILQVSTENRASAEALAQRIVDVVSAPYALGAAQAAIGTSIGIARSHDAPEAEQLFHNADLALYRVKAEGRNHFRLFEHEMDAAAQARRQLEDELRHARERGELEIHYQPVIGLASRTILGVEALLRWNHPARGRLSPADFMPVAEEIGLMPAIDAWVLETACAEAMRWPDSPRIAVNLSPARFKRRNLVEVVRRALAQSELPAQRLELEISERILLPEEDHNLVALQALRDIGVRIALDDFGVGSSSLSDLRAFRFDNIKIDRSFVADMPTRDDCAAIVTAIAGLGRNLGADTTAEGVETPEQAAFVRAAGCTLAQGYLYARPVSAAEIRALLESAEIEAAVA
jgi:diguanylate cyclase (GGDEF)-like protein